MASFSFALLSLPKINNENRGENMMYFCYISTQVKTVNKCVHALRISNDNEVITGSSYADVKKGEKCVQSLMQLSKTLLVL